MGRIDFFKTPRSMSTIKNIVPPLGKIYLVVLASFLQWPYISFPLNWPVLVRAKSLQSCPTLCYPMGSSPPGCSVHGVLQARILEWVAMPSSRGFSRPRDGTQLSSFVLVVRFFNTSTNGKALSAGLICSINFGSLLPAFLLTPLNVCVPLPVAFYTWGELWMVADKRPANHTN